jgi:hypothetical protein
LDDRVSTRRTRFVMSWMAREGWTLGGRDIMSILYGIRTKVKFVRDPFGGFDRAGFWGKISTGGRRHGTGLNAETQRRHE